MSEPFLLRPFDTGDIGMVAARQAILYRESNGWGRLLEINVGETAFAFLRQFKPGREQCWIAEVDGRIAGSVFLTDEGEGLSRLRLLYVEPFARGLGVGNGLVAECVRFARAQGYSRMTLWTHTVLASARRIYAAHGFAIVDRAVHHEFGEPIEGETWERAL